jgi:hypothetical protein
MLAATSRQRIEQSGKVNIDDAGHRPVGLGTTDNRQDSEQHDVQQSMQLALCPPGLCDFGQHKSTNGPHDVMAALSAVMQSCQPEDRTAQKRGTPNPLSQSGSHPFTALQGCLAPFTVEESVEQRQPG